MKERKAKREYVVYQHGFPLIVGTKKECCKYLDVDSDKFDRLMGATRCGCTGRNGAITIYRVEEEDEDSEID